MAIHLNGLNFTRMTEDIDYINYRPTPQFLEITKRIATKFNLPNDWINSRANEINPLPIELKKKLKTDTRYSNIILSYIDIETTIIMKVYAYYIRNLEKDLSDLKLLSPTQEQITKGIAYLELQIKYHHGENQLLKDQGEIQNFKEFLKNELK